MAFVEIAPVRARPLLARFIDEFIDPERAAELRALLDAFGARDLPSIWRAGCAPIAPGTDAGGCARWLASGRTPARCLRFERRASLPALEIDLATLDDTWAASWPGVFVSFAAGRAVMVTLDYEELRCHLRATPATPYQ